jgi:plastocyanin domain-containing protein
MKSKTIFFGSIFSIVLVGGIILFSLLSRNNGSTPNGGASTNVSVVDGKQYIDVMAKGGYSPRSIVAKAGMPTVLRVKTQGTFDCSSGLTIPKLKYQKNLPPTGVEEIPVSADQAQGTLQGMCSMGMYSFKIAFN